MRAGRTLLIATSIATLGTGGVAMADVAPIDNPGGSPYQPQYASVCVDTPVTGVALKGDNTGNVFEGTTADDFLIGGRGDDAIDGLRGVDCILS